MLWIWFQFILFFDSLLFYILPRDSNVDQKLS